MTNRLRFRPLLALPVALLALVVAGGASSAPPPQAPPKPAAPPPTSYVADPPRVWIPATGGTPCPVNELGLICYTAPDIRRVYDVPATLDGTGQTVVLVAAYGSSTIKPDLAQFDAENGLPAPPSLTITGPNGSGNPSDPNVQGWALETNLDVEWAHAIAPGARLVLSVAPSDDAHALTDAVARAVQRYPGAIISQSFGGDEAFARQGFIDYRAAHRVYAAAAALGDSVLAATGDWGASGEGDTGLVAMYPATDPLVTAVGGTMGDPWPQGLQAADGSYGGEQAWNESDGTGYGATGGGPSQIFGAPAYQSGTGYAKRTVPDVSYNASFTAGVVVVFQGLHGLLGGTSASTPQWAGVLALANQARANAGAGPLGPANAALYAVAQQHPDAFHDITAGDNTSDPRFPGFSAGSGYDLATGLGTPDVAKLVSYLIGAPGAPPPSRLANVTCANQQLSGAYRNVRVPFGTWCDLEGASVAGNLQADRATGIRIVGTTIGGDVHVARTSGTGGYPTNAVCNSVVMGNADISDNAAPFSIGGACTADVTGSTASVFGNDLNFDNNAATTNDVTGNTIFGNLVCIHDGSAGGGGNNVAGIILGQCTGSKIPGS
jgi:hypothetical protein